MKNTEANIELIIELRKKNQLNFFCTFIKLKNYFSSGYFYKEDIKSFLKENNIPKSTFYNQFKKMLQEGWISCGKNGYFLRSWKIFKIKTFTIKAATPKELLALAACYKWEQSVNKRIYKENIDRSRSVLRLKKRLGKCDPKYSVGVKFFADKLGYKSLTSGSKIEKSMEELGLVKIKRESMLIGPANTILPIINRIGIRSHFFVKNGKVYQRLKNKITRTKK